MPPRRQQTYKASGRNKKARSYLHDFHSNVNCRISWLLTCRRRNHCSCGPVPCFPTGNNQPTNENKPGVEQLHQLLKDDCRSASLAHAYHNAVVADRRKPFHCLHSHGIDTSPLLRNGHILWALDLCFQQLCLRPQDMCNLSILEYKGSLLARLVFF